MTVFVFHIQPRAKSTEIVGWHDDAIKVRLRAPPVDGAANDELVRFLAGQTGVPPSAVNIVGGKASRRKRVHIDGVSEADFLHAVGLNKP